MFKRSDLSLFSLLLVLLYSTSPSADDKWAPGLPLGATIPSIEALDQHGNTMTSAELMGSNGLLLFFNRSTSW